MAICAQCGKQGAALRAEVWSPDESWQSFRFWCNVTCHANWGTNQPEVTSENTKPKKGMAMADLIAKILDANKQGWYLLNFFQFGDNRWRINLHYRQPKGSHVSEFAEGDTAEEAFDAVWKSAQARMKTTKGTTVPAVVLVPARNELTPEQERRLVKALEACWLAIKLNGGTRGKDREAGL